MPIRGSMDYTLRWSQNKFNWNGQWAGTRSAIDGEMKNGFGGVTNFNYSSKHFGGFGHYDYFNSTFKNSDLGFFGSRNNKTQVNGGVYVSNPDPGKVFRQRQRRVPATSRSTTATGCRSTRATSSAATASS